MKPLTAAEIRGNWATLLLPIRADDTIDYELLGAQIDHFLRCRVSGIYSNGTAGEFHTQTEAEFDRINQLLAEKCNAASLPFQVGVSHMSAQLSRERLRRARALKPSAFQVIFPDWAPPTLDDIHRFLEVMEAEAGPIPLIVYNPPHAKRVLTPADWKKIADRHPGVAGAKTAGGDDAWYDEMRPLFSRMSIFIPGHTLANGLRRGAHGAYSNVACLNPRGAQAWYERCLSDPAAALEIQEKIIALFNEDVRPLIIQRAFSNTAVDKALAAAGGWLPGFSPRLRWPYAEIPAEDIARIARRARERVPELFSI